MKYIVICLILFSSLAKAQKSSNILYERQIIKDALSDKVNKQVLVNKIIPDKETTIAIAEPILFKVYGKKHILGEKPYNVDLVDGYWVLSGSLKAKSGEDIVGATFLIILSEKDGRVIKLTHGK